jgi:hypothetical protein
MVMGTLRNRVTRSSSAVVEASQVDPWHWEPIGHQRAAETIGKRLNELLR